MQVTRYDNAWDMVLLMVVSELYAEDDKDAGIMSIDLQADNTMIIEFLLERIEQIQNYIKQFINSLYLISWLCFKVTSFPLLVYPKWHVWIYNDHEYV